MTDGDISHPVFLQCIEYCTDKFWEKIFKDLTKGITPYGIYFHNDYICHGKPKKGKDVDRSMENNKPEEIDNNVYSLISENAGILSPTERINKNHFITTDKTINDIEDWSDIKKKSTKDILIELFAIKMRKEYNLSIIQCRFLISIIAGALTFKSITSNDIEIKDCMILKINGINFSEQNVEYSLDIYNLEDTDVTNKTGKMGKSLMLEHWYKFITEIEKKNDL